MKKCRKVFLIFFLNDDPLRSSSQIFFTDLVSNLFRMRPRDIGTVFMTGGSSGLPILRACVGHVLPGVPIAMGDMLGSVGTGLALEAQRRFG